MFGNFGKGFVSSFTSGKALGGLAAVFVALAVVYAFLPAFSPEGLAARVNEYTGKGVADA